MTESVASAYRTLFQLRLLHHFWLDEGATVFDLIADQAKRDARLLTYDVRKLLTIAPTRATSRTLAGLRCVYKPTALGCVVAVPADTKLPTDAAFEFALSANSSDLLDYTALTLRARKVYELYNATDDTHYRYKENVPLLSNLTGVTRGAGANARLFLSREIPAAGGNDPVESLVLDGAALKQLTADDPGAGLQEIAAQAADLPVYVHQADAPAIVPPAGLAGAPARGIALTPDVPDDVFALIHLEATRADDATFSFVDGTGAPKASPPIYEVHFRNRATVWTYRSAKTGAVTSSEPNPLPLTFFGNAGTKQKPSRGFVKAQMNGARVARLISDIYV